MNQEETILVIDDDLVVRKFLSKALSSNFTVTLAENGEEGLQLALANIPDYILLDIEMPGINGYEVCRTLKSNIITRAAPIIFLSSRSSLGERIQGYELGAADFIIKPCDSKELQAKLHAISTAKIEAKLAAKAAYSAMRSSSELGLAIHYIEDTYSIYTIKCIANRFLEVTKSIGLSCTLMFDIDKEKEFFSENVSVYPLEQELIRAIHTKGERFTDFGTRTQINYPNVALLVKNMPLDDQETHGRYKDFLPIMLGATNEKVRALDTEHAWREQTSNLNNSFALVRQTLEKVGDVIQENQEEVVMLLRSMNNELTDRIPQLGLEEDQEEYLLQRLDKTISSSQEIIESGEDARQTFGTVCRLLDHLSNRQHRLLDQSTNNVDDMMTKYPSSNGSSSDEIELF